MPSTDEIRHFDNLAGKQEAWLKKSDYYHRTIADYIKFLVPESASVLQIGCGIGNVIASVPGSRRVDIDFSPKMIETAREKYPDVEFCIDDLENLQIDEKFDYILVINVSRS